MVSKASERHEAVRNPRAEGGVLNQDARVGVRHVGKRPASLVIQREAELPHVGAGQA